MTTLKAVYLVACYILRTRFEGGHLKSSDDATTALEIFNADKAYGDLSEHDKKVAQVAMRTLLRRSDYGKIRIPNRDGGFEDAAIDSQRARLFVLRDAQTAVW